MAFEISSDGLDINEKTNIMFKKYMNFASTGTNRTFPDETEVKNNNTIFQASIMNTKPEITTSYTALTQIQAINKLTEKGFNVNASWCSDNLDSTEDGYVSNFQFDENNSSVLRFSVVKLKHIANTAAFSCFDNSDVNMLENLIPFNYATSGYSIGLSYKKDDGSMCAINWLDDVATQRLARVTGNANLEWGSPLFDTTNGIVVFYDVAYTTSATYNEVFGSEEFYITCTKYIGDMGGSSGGSGSSLWSDVGSNISYSSGSVTVNNIFNVSDKVTLDDDLDVSGSIDISGSVDICSNLTVKGDIILHGDLLDESGNLINTGGGGSSGWTQSGDDIAYATGDVTIGHDLSVNGTIIGYATDAELSSLTGRVVTLEASSGSSGSSGSSSGGGGVAIQTTEHSIVAIDNTDPAYNTDASSAYKSYYRTRQPPLFTVGSTSSQSTSIEISWNDFKKTYIDAYTGRAYPLSFQTYVDISCDATGGVYKTIFVGPGNCGSDGSLTAALTTFTLHSDVDTDYSNNTGMTPYFEFPGETARPDQLTTLGAFTQSTKFDFRVYGLNQSQGEPNPIYFTNLSLLAILEPGEVTVTNTDNFLKASFQMDVSFLSDGTKPETSGSTNIPIIEYDVSFTLTGTKSYVSRTHVDSFQITGSSLDKDDLVVSSMFPGAKYNIQVRAKNSLATGQPFGPYGSSYFTTTGFTQYLSGTDVMYVDTDDLNDVNGIPDNYITLANSAELPNIMRGTTGPESVLVGLKDESYISIRTTPCNFYVNYGHQGLDIPDGTTTLVTATLTATGAAGATGLNGSIDYDGVAADADPTATLTDQTITLLSGYTFTNSDTYTDMGISGDTEGFVYGSSLTRNDSSTTSDLKTHFNTHFPPDTSASLKSFDLSIQTNSGVRLTKSSSSNPITSGTDNFCVDDYSGNPGSTVTFTPTLTVDSSSTLFGIPSILSVTLAATMDSTNNIRDFASTTSGIIPHLTSATHTKIVPSFNDSNMPTFDTPTSGTKTSASSYSLNYSSAAKTISSGRYISATDGKFTTHIPYMSKSGSTPQVSTVEIEDSFSTFGAIFRDSVTSYGCPLTLYRYDSDTSKIVTTAARSTTSAVANDMMLYFNGNFVCGGYTTSIANSSFSPWRDWSETTWLQPGAADTDYSTQGSSGTTVSGVIYKWVTFHVTGYRTGNEVNLSTIKIGRKPSGGTYSETSLVTAYNTPSFGDYKAYLVNVNSNNDQFFGSLTRARAGGATDWWGLNSTSISLADSIGNGAVNSNDTGALSPSQPSSTWDTYIIVGLVANSDDYVVVS
jgi:hypothetical protein